MMPQFNSAQIRSYYDRHTRDFVTFGQGGKVGAIHRAVWGPNTQSRTDAFKYVERLIAARLEGLSELDGSQSPYVLDLGCGVGATLCGLAEQVRIRGLGITLSPIQAQLASQRIRAAGLSDRIRCIEGDYCELPGDVEKTDLAYAIESFVHGPDPERFFEECARIIRPGGVLVICDDFRRKVVDSVAARTVERFCRGWHINTLLRQDELRALAREAGFGHELTVDLSSYLETNRPRDHAITLLIALFGWLPSILARFDYLVGGSALRKCLAEGWTGYEFAQFRRLE